MRRWIWQLLKLLIALAVVLVLVFLWATRTQTGLQFALARAKAYVEVQSVTGSLDGPMTLRGVRVRWPAAGRSVQNQIDIAQLDVQLHLSGQTLRQKVVIGSMRARGVVVQLMTPEGRGESSDSSALSFTIGPTDVRDLRVMLDENEVANITALTAKGLRLTGTRLKLDELQVDEQRGKLAANGQIDLRKKGTSDLQLSVQTHDGVYRLAARLQGPRDALQAKLTLMQPGAATPEIASFNGTLSNLFSGKPGWNGQLVAQALSPAQLGFQSPMSEISMALEASGDLHNARAKGSFEINQQSFSLRELDIGLTEQLLIRDLDVGLAQGGSLRAKGHWPIQSSAPAAELSLSWKALALPESLGWPKGLMSAQGEAVLTGNLASLRLQLDAALARLDLQGQIKLDAQVREQTIDLANLVVQADAGQLVLKGTLDLPDASMTTRWNMQMQADAINPAILLPEWPGLLSANLQSAGQWQAGKPTGTLDIQSLSGSLRGEPISGLGKLAFQRNWLPTGALNLRWGVNQAELYADLTGQRHAIVNLPAIAALWPGATGALEGDIRWQARATGLEVTGTARGHNVSIAELKLAEMDANVQWPSKPGAPLKVDAHASDGSYAGQSFKALQVLIDGQLGQHQINATLKSAPGTVSIVGNGALEITERRANIWRGQITQLGVQSGEWKADLQSPSALTLQWQAERTAIELGNTCFQVDYLLAKLSTLCGQGIWSNSGSSRMSVQISALQLAALMDPASNVQVTGTLAGSGELEFELGQLQNSTIKLEPSDPIALILQANAADKNRLNVAQLNLQVSNQSAGPIALSLDGALDDGSLLIIDQLSLRGDALSGNVRFELAKLSVLEGLSESMANWSGKLQGDISLSGTASAPQFNGQAQAVDVSVEVPAAGLVLKQGQLDFTGNADRISISGTVFSGTGKLNLTGSLTPFGKAKAQLSVVGDKVLVANTASAVVYASPNLSFSHYGDLLRIKGSVDLPEAQVNLARMEARNTASSDVIVVDDAKTNTELPIRADVVVSLGENVSLKGFGLNGKVKGSIKIRERPNKAATARGTLDVSGTYRAYGQKLEIERGKLTYASAALSNPSLDIRAFRKIDRVMAGVQVRGTALEPTLSVWSDPVKEQSDALGYLILGRPLRGASDAESAQVGAAAGALQTAGGNLIAQSVGQRVGLELGVETLSDIGGTAFTAGKFLSPALYVGYGRSLVNAQTLLIVRYRFREKYEFEALSGREQKIGVNFRTER